MLSVQNAAQIFCLRSEMTPYIGSNVQTAEALTSRVAACTKTFFGKISAKYRGDFVLPQEKSISCQKP